MTLPPVLPAADLTSWRPLVLDPVRADDRRALDELLRSGRVFQGHDTLLDQLRELLAAREPARRRDPAYIEQRVCEHLADLPAWHYGRWVFYPWSGRLVHLLGPAELRELRADRNRYKLTADEQGRLARCRIGVIGLSVGQAAALTLVLEGIGAELRIADPDLLAASNLNRLRAGVADLGVNKTVLAARAIAELDPYVRVVPFPEGVTGENLDRFLAEDGRLDLLVEESDDLFVKVRAREQARHFRIPVIMATDDRGLLDIERFDLEPHRPLFHGLAGDLDAARLRGLSTRDKVPYVLRIIGEGACSGRFAASLIEIDHTLVSFPQLGSEVMLGAALAVNAARRVLLGELAESGRYYADIDEIVHDGRAFLAPDAGPIEVELSAEALADPILRTSTCGVEVVARTEIRSLVEHGTFAPSGGNVQPWRFAYDGGRILAFLDRKRAESFLDFQDSASFLAFGAVAENMELAAAGLGLRPTLELLPEGGHPDLVFTLRVAPDPAVREAGPPPLLGAIAARCTNRKLGRRVPLADEDVRALDGAADAYGVRLQLLEAPAELEEIGRILGSGDRVRFLSRVMHREMMGELRWSPEEVERTRDGVDLATLEFTPSDKAALRLLASWSALKFVQRVGGGRALEKSSRDSVASASAVGLLTVDGQDGRAFFRAGRAMQRVWLTATGRGLAFQPMTALTYVFARLEGGAEGLSDREREALGDLRARYRQLFDVPPGHAEPMLFRVAHADPPTARALRRHVDDVLVFED